MTDDATIIMNDHQESNQGRGAVRLRASIAEPILNALGRPLLTGAWVALAAVTGFLAMAWSLGESNDIVTTWNHQVDAGRYVVKIHDVDGGRLNAIRCEQLNQQDGVLAAGGVVSMGTATPRLDASHPIQKIVTTPGFVELAWPHSRPSELVSTIAGADLATRLGLQPGSLLQTFRTGRSGALVAHPVGEVADRPSRIEGINQALVIAQPAAGELDECLVSLDPSAASAMSGVLLGWFDEDVIVSPLLPHDTLRVDPELLLPRRLSLWAGLVAVLALGALRLTDWWARRAEYALYRVLGFRRRNLVVMLTTEVGVGCLLPAQLGAALAVAQQREITSVAGSAALATEVSMLAGLATLPIFGLLMVGLRSCVGSIKDS